MEWTWVPEKETWWGSQLAALLALLKAAAKEIVKAEGLVEKMADR